MQHLPFSFLLLFAVLFACQPDVERPKVGADTVEFPALKGNIADTAIAGAYLEKSPVMIDSGKFERALEMAQKAAHIFSKQLGNSHVRVADAWIQVGAYFLLLSNCNASLRDSAMVYYQQALNSYSILFGEKSDKVADAYDGIGTIQSLSASDTMGLETLQKAVSIRKSVLGENHPSLIKTYGNIGRYYYLKGQYPKASEYFDAAVEVWNSTRSLEKMHIVPAYINMGNIQFRLGQLDTAMKYLRLAEEITLAEKGPFHFRMTEIHNNIAAVYYLKGKYDQALPLLEKAIENETRIVGSNNCPRISATLMTIGALYSKYGQYQKSLEYHQKVLDMRTRQQGWNAFELAETHYNVANAYYSMWRYKEAEQHFDKAARLYVDNGAPEHPILVWIYNGLGNTHEKLGSLDAALKHWQKALFLIQKAPEQNQGDAAMVRLGIGRAYVKRKQFDAAAKMYQDAYGIFRKIYGDGHFWPLRALGHFTMLELARDNPEAALRYNDSALRSLNYYKQGNIHDAVSLKDLVDFLASRATIERKLYQKTGSVQYLENEVQTAKTALQALDALKESYVEPASKRDLIAASYEIFENAIAANFMLAKRSGDYRYWEEVFLQIEQSKASLMRESLHDFYTRNAFRLPDNLLEREQELKTRIGKMEQERYQKQQSAASKEARDSIFTFYTGQIFDLKKSFDTLRQIFATTYPEYYRLRYDGSVIGVEQIQQTLLSPRQALLEYFVGDSSIFIFAVRPDTFRVVEVKKDFPLKSWVADMRAGLSELDMQGTAKYARAAHHIYTKIFQPVQEFLTGRDLIIVPDGELGYVPFDALLVAMPADLGNFRDSFPYLLKEHQISISYSATLLREMRQKRHERPPSKSFLGIAPYFPGTKTDSSGVAGRQTHIGALPRLFKNKTEVEKIQSLLGGDIFVDDAATEQAFSEMASKYRILHLSTHGAANDQAGDYSYLAFYELNDGEENELLFNRELYNLRLNADLVVLSACETGIGELQRGEGIISLARGFSYAGAKSIVTTLWKVEEAATAELMQQFYKNLQKGMAKDEALRAAKQYLLKETPNANPFYWAAFVPVGDMEPIISQSGDLWIWLLGLAGAAVLAVLLWRRKKKA